MKRFSLLILVFTVHTSTAQTLKWAKQLKASWSVASPTVISDQYSNIYMMAPFEDSINIGTDTNPHYMYSGYSRGSFLAKYDSSGHLLWGKKIDGPNSSTHVSGIALDQSGHLYIAGSYTDSIEVNLGQQQASLKLSCKGRSDIFMLKLDTSGSTIWAKSWGGAGQDYAGSLLFDKTGDMYMMVSSDDDITLGNKTFMANTGSGHFEMILVKLDPQANPIWTKKFNADYYNLSGVIALTKSGNVIVAGNYDDSLWINHNWTMTGRNHQSAGAVFLAKFSSTGQFIWLKGFDVDIGQVRVHDMMINTKDKIILTGHFYGQGTDFDPDTSVHKIFNSPHPPGYNPKEAYVVALDTNGAFQTAKVFRSTGTVNGIGILRTYPSAILEGKNGETYINGYFYGKTDFDPDTSSYILSPNTNDLFMVKLDSNFKLQWAFNWGGSSVLRSFSFAIDPQNNIIGSGYFSDSLDCDPGAGSQYIYCSAPFVEHFLFKFNENSISTALPTEQVNDEIQLYPNPTSDMVWIEVKDPEDVQLKLFDQLGKLVKEKSLRNKRTNIKLPEQKGLYFLHIQSKNASQVKKIIKQNP